ncbi:thiolase [Conidiobolus coronatus NRRL 28638]|uniref:Thiolase n=1 Tax=Conidiobolus coronatus (strain ATCC 28846 / CBS 209.66 / NRRL 28638) TaxID=796925 RepID=A0A137P3B8_CONC2|nr:thiolase [Conidiobolus coronatus NRRL 28638]|eukprot:KXN69468.1 thiolase [Conidiobolus coronatus NRRL 28638]
MASRQTKTFIVAAKRTPFGAFLGSLKGYSATQLGGIAAKAALAELPKNTPVDSVVFGNVCQTSACAPYLARHVGHQAGLDIQVPALTINRLCGSGFQSVINAVQEIRSGDAKVVLTGGSESMSQAPYVLRDARSGTKFGIDLKLEDSLFASLTDRYPTVTPMGITAENLGQKYNISRDDCDQFALISQQRWAAAQASGQFKDEIVPVEVKVKKAKVEMKDDEHPRPQTQIENLKKLPSVFIKDTGLVTAGNASGISDGAAAIVVAGEEAVSQYGLEPMCEIVSYEYVGVEPTIMGIGPVPAIQGALKKAGLTLDQMDLIEVNEAFAAQYLAVEKELGLDRSKTNINGGAIALGHPLAASGSRILTHLAYQLKNKGLKYAIGAACIGGGQGIAVVLKNTKA